MSDLLTVEDLSIDFVTMAGRIRAVSGLSFRVPQHGTVAIVGESGSGKSVTAQAILGILPRPARRLGGRILFTDGDSETIDLAALPRRGEAFQRIRGDRIAMIFQEPTTSLSAYHTIGNQIAEVLAIHKGVTGAPARSAAIEALRQVGFSRPEETVDAYPFELSGGLCQRAMIAMAMICRPALLIADEPTTALDVTIQAEILKLMRQLQEEHGTAILLIAHDLGVVANMADEMVVLHHGKVVERGTAADLFADPRHPYLKALLNAVPRFHMARTERLQPIRDIRVDLPARAPRREAPAGEAAAVLLRARGITKGFAIRRQMRWLSRAPPPMVLALDDVSIDIRKGECLGLVGESGSGKTTLSKIIARSLAPDLGSVEMRDEEGMVDVLALRGEELRRWRRKVQYVFQDPISAFNPRMTIGSILLEPLEIHGIGNAKSRRARVKELLRLVGLDDFHANRYPHSLSGGQRQRIGVARALALEPELIIFDEPVSALDVSIQAQILNLLRDLKAALDLTYLFISHNLAVVDYLADRIAVMAAGRLVEIAPREILFRSPIHPYTRALIAAVPQPDPDKRLDFERVDTHRQSDAAKWGAPYQADERGEPHLVELAPDHFVRAHAKPGDAFLGGRTIEEHVEIARAVESDPKGTPDIHLDFETGDLSGWSVRRLAGPHSAVVQSEIVRVGSHACRFELRAEDLVSQGRRAELRDWFNAPLEQETWYGFSTLLPADFAPPKDVGLVLAQWHDQATLGHIAGKPPLAIRYRDGALRFTGAAGKVASPEPDAVHLFHEISPAPRGRWLDFVFRIRWSRRKDSLLEAFLDGRPLFEFEGPLGYRNERLGPYFKIGIYASGPIDTPLVVYHDNYSRGRSFDAVDPAILHSRLTGALQEG